MSSESRRAFVQDVASTVLGLGVIGNAPIQRLDALIRPPRAPGTPQSASGIKIVDGLPSGAGSPIAYRIHDQFDLLAPMRDGVKLAMDLVRPDTDAPCPVVLVRTPYDKVLVRPGAQVEDLARRGYIVAMQDCRGRFNSDGSFDPYRQEHNDGFDTVEWLTKQPWCSGSIGMIGGSYTAQTQWFAASQAPKGLKAIVPHCSPPGHPFMNEPFYGGTLILAMIEWVVAMGRRSFQSPALTGVLTKFQPYFDARPVAAMETAGGTSSPFFEEWVKHPLFDDFWKSCGYEQFWPQMTVPAFNVTGWWDMNFLGASRNFVGMQQHGATDDARKGQRLIIGPWEHWVNRTREMSGVDFGPDAIVDLNGYELRFFDRWLRGKQDNGIDGDPRVHVFVLGANQWWEADQWPLPGMNPTPLYLHSDGGANTHHGDGKVSFQAPKKEAHDTFVSDPLDPVSAPWSLHEGPVDDRPASERADVLCYTSEPLTTAVDAVGPVSGVIFASSSAADCDWHVRIVDVYPDGTARFICHGALRARFREGYDRTAFLKAGEVTRFEVAMTAMGARFLPGHRIRIEVSSSWFPRFDVNPQTGTADWMTDTTPPVVAHQVVLHDQQYPSHILLPLISDAPRST
jgi:putative CocE/NonD family hydrolase